MRTPLTTNYSPIQKNSTIIASNHDEVKNDKPNNVSSNSNSKNTDEPVIQPAPKKETKDDYEANRLETKLQSTIMLNRISESPESKSLPGSEPSEVKLAMIAPPSVSRSDQTVSGEKHELSCEKTPSETRQDVENTSRKSCFGRAWDSFKRFSILEKIATVGAVAAVVGIVVTAIIGLPILVPITIFMGLMLFFVIGAFAYMVRLDRE